jgi:hypothetical protein
LGFVIDLPVTCAENRTAESDGWLRRSSRRRRQDGSTSFIRFVVEYRLGLASSPLEYLIKR